MSWLYFLAEANVYLGVFYLAYCLLLKRDTHYQLNRVFLLFSCVISFVLPVLQVGALKPVTQIKAGTMINYTVPQTNADRADISLSQEQQTFKAVTITNATPVMKHRFTLTGSLVYIYLTGAAISLFLLVIRLYALLRIIGYRQNIKKGEYRLVNLHGSNGAFSFFNYLFIGTDVSGADTIIRHELVHIRQKHSADILFLELIKIISWFNPLVYLVQKSLKSVHEYIADEQAAHQETDTLAYSLFLVSNACGANYSSLTHSFFNYNLLKQRIIMLNQQRSGNLARLKYLVALPICAFLLCISTLAISKSYAWVDLAPSNPRSAVTYPIAGTKRTEKHKLLNITETGVHTLTGEFAISRNGQSLIHIDARGTAAHNASLLKTRNIKVEVSEDSTKFTTIDGKPILPIVNVDGYYIFDHFLHDNIRYTTAKGEKGGLVEVAFTLDKDRHITDPQIVKSGGPKLDALALNGFNAYKGIVNDDPGRNLKLGVYFFTGDYSIFKTDSLGKDPEFAGELIITNYKYPATVTSKGYEYNESNAGFGKALNTRVVIYDKNGGANWFYKNTSTATDLKLLKDKYGYIFPSGYSGVVQLIYPEKGNNNHWGFIFDAESYLDNPYADQFYDHMVDNTEYPEHAKKALTGGVVVLNFDLDNTGTISDVNVAQSAGNGFDQAAVNALKSYKTAIKDNAGKHSIAVVFCVVENKYRPAVSEKIKKDGYVGEVSITDIKSQFGR